MLVAGLCLSGKYLVNILCTEVAQPVSPVRARRYVGWWGLRRLYLPYSLRAGTCCIHLGPVSRQFLNLVPQLCKDILHKLHHWLDSRTRRSLWYLPCIGPDFVESLVSCRCKLLQYCTKKHRWFLLASCYENLHKLLYVLVACIAVLFHCTGRALSVSSIERPELHCCPLLVE